MSPIANTRRPPSAEALDKFSSIAIAHGLPPEFAQRIVDDPRLRRFFVTWALDNMRPVPEGERDKLIYGVWTSLDDLVEKARASDGVTGDKIDTMLKVARDRGLVDGYNAAIRCHRRLGMVVQINQDTVWETFLYVRRLLRRTWGTAFRPIDQFDEPMFKDAMSIHPKARPFVPGELSLQVVDFTANWRDGDQEMHCGAGFVGFELMFAAAQHREWVWRMGDDDRDPRIPVSERMPSATAVGLVVRPLPTVSWETCVAISNLDSLRSNPGSPRRNKLVLSLLRPRKFADQALPVLWTPR